MDIQSASHYLKQRYKIRRKPWNEKHCLEADYNSYILTLEDLLANDWEIVK